MEIDERKLKFPVYASYSIRDRLYEKLDQSWDASLVLIMGESGYGKTTLVSSYIREKNIPTIWYQLKATDRYAHIFVSHLEAGFLKLSNQSVPTYEIKPEHVDNVLENLFISLSEQKTPLFVVLDDYQWIDDSPEIEHIILQLLEHASSKVTFIITSRVFPSLPTTKLKIEQRYKEITTHDIAFTLEETEEFYNIINRLDLRNHELRLIHQRTEGWVASYQLILGVIVSMTYEQRMQFWSTFPKMQDIYDYLSMEVLETQSKEIKSFLYWTSLLPELNARIINKFLEIDHAEQILAQLLNKHMFIYRDDHGVIRYHHLFRQYLYGIYHEKYSEEVIAKEHCKLGEIYESSFQLIYAFAHYTVGKDYLKATEVMSLMRNRYNPVESMLLLDGRLDEISPNESFASNTLFIIRCIPFKTLKELTVLFEESIAQLEEEKNKLWLCSLQHRLATIYLVSGDIIRAKELFQRALVGSEKFHDHAMTSLNLTLLAEIHRYLGENLQAMEYVRKSLFLSDEHRLKHMQVHALDTLTMIHLDEGNLEDASICIHQALGIAEKSDQSSLIFIYTTMGRFWSEKGDSEEAIRWGKKAVSLAESYQVEFDTGWANFELGNSYARKGVFNDALYCYEQASNAFKESNLYHVMVELSRQKLFEQKGESERAKRKNDELQSIIKKNNYFWLNKKGGSIVNVKNDEIDTMLTISTLGTFKMQLGSENIVLKRSSSIRLLQYFIANRNKRIERDLILDEIFGEGKQKTNQFQVALSVLRKALEPQLTSGTQSNFIKREGNHYIFDSTKMNLDVDKIAELMEESRSVKVEQKMKKFQKIVHLYKGNFFEEYLYEEFLEREREDVSKQYAIAIQFLANASFENANFDESYAYFELLIKHQPDEEKNYYDYIQALLKQELESRAIVLANEMIRYFQQEIGVSVEEELTVLFEKFNRTLHV